MNGAWAKSRTTDRQADDYPAGKHERIDGRNSRKIKAGSFRKELSNLQSRSDEDDSFQLASCAVEGVNFGEPDYKIVWMIKRNFESNSEPQSSEKAKSQDARQEIQEIGAKQLN